MADHAHTTTAVTLATPPDPVRSAVLERATAAQLTLPPEVPAYLTHSRRLTKPGILARLTKTADTDAEHLTALVLGRKDVLVATSKPARHRGARRAPRGH